MSLDTKAHNMKQDTHTAPAPRPAAPATKAERIQALDATRGFAVLGILLMNIWSFAGPHEISTYPPIAASWGGAPLQTWAIAQTLFEGSQRALFSMLFGAGMLLLVGRLEAGAANTPVARIYYRRLWLLMGFGLFDAFVLMWAADILIIYALCGLLLYPLRRLGTRSLVVCAVIVFAIPATLRTLDWQESTALQAEYAAWQAGPDARSLDDAMPNDVTPNDMTPDDSTPGDATPEDATPARIKAWEAKLKRARPDLTAPDVQESIRINREGALGEFIVERVRVSLILQIFVGLKSWFFDALGAMLLGMALFRSGMLTLRAPISSYVGLAVAGYCIGLPIAAWETAALIAADFDPLLKARNLIHYDLRRIAVALGHLGAILLLCRALPASGIVRRIAAVGRMALSNYLGQSILGLLIFSTIGFGWYGRFTGYYLYIVVAGVWAIQIFFSNWWLARFRFGPFEWIWRSLTYRKRQPMR